MADGLGMDCPRGGPSEPIVSRSNRRLLVIGLFLAAGLAASPARGEEVAGPGFVVEVPAGYVRYANPDGLGSLLSRHEHALVKPSSGGAQPAVYVKGDALAPEGVLILGRVPTSELEIAGDLDAYARMLRRTPVLPSGVTVSVFRPVLASGESALLAELATPAGRGGGTPDARLLLASNDPQHRTLVLWFGTAAKGGVQDFDTVLASLKILPRPDRFQQVVVWGILAVAGLLLLALTLVRAHAARRGGTVNFGSRSPGSELATRPSDGLPTFGVGIPSHGPGAPGGPHGMASHGASHSGAPAGLRMTGRTPGR